MKAEPLKNGVIEFTFNSSADLRAVLDHVYNEIKSGEMKVKSSIKGCGFNFRVSKQVSNHSDVEFQRKTINGKTHFIVPSKINEA